MAETDKAATHRARMREVQRAHRARIKEKSRAERGLLAVHTGKGKGKSTAAFGLIVRALGWGHDVGVVQFIKGTWKTGEKEFFARFDDLVTFRRMGEGFTWDTQDRDRDIAAATAAFATAREMMESGAFDLVVLDEINIALRYEYLSVETVLEALKARSERTAVILTGRDAKPEICEYADLVTEMEQVKHPFQAGIKAQRGVDF